MPAPPSLTVPCLLLLGLAASAALAAASARPPSTDGWRQRAPLPEPRFEMATAVVDGRLLVFGGFGPGVTATTRVDAYDPATDRWQRLADMPEALTHVNTAVDGRQVWLAGGFLDTGSGPATLSVWRYDADQDRFESGPPLPEARAGGGLAVLGDRLHYVGGLRADRDTDAADHWSLDLDPVEISWQLAASMPDPRNQFGVIVHDGRLYLVGGQHRHDSTLRAPLDRPRVDVYDPQTDTWSRGTDLPGPLSHVEPGAFAQDGRLVVVGGRGAGGLQSSILELSPGGAWRVTAELPQALLAPGARAIGDLLIVVGGALDGYRPQATTWVRPW